MAFVLALHKSQEVNDAILHDDILADQMRPALPFNLGKKPLTNGTVINACRCSIGRHQSLQKIAACYNADEVPILDDQHAFDTMLLHDLCTFSKRSRRSYGNHRSGHDLPGDMAVCLDVITRQSVCAGKDGQPRGPALVTDDLCVLDQIALADDPDYALLSIDHWNATDTLRVHEFRDIADRGLRCDAKDLGCHDISYCQHGLSPEFVSRSGTLATFLGRRRSGVAGCRTPGT